MDFKSWANFGQALCAFVETALYLEHDRILKEGRRNPDALRNASVSTTQAGLFDDPDEEVEDKYARPDYKHCPITPLSSYDKEISVIKNYALQNPSNFAQVMLFSPLSANVNFAKHWDNFPVLMTVLRVTYPDKIPSVEELRKTLSSFNEKYSMMGATISGFKYDTIFYVWNNKEQLWNDVRKAAASGDDVKLLSQLVKIPGVLPVKAGFMAQLIFGRSGCLDTHNIDIYSKVWPDMAKQLDPKLWGTKGAGSVVNKKTIAGLKQYTKTIKQFEKRGIGTKELWDVWVDFVGFMYKKIMDGGLGLYANLKPALNPNDPKYQDLLGHINKMGITASGKKNNKIVPVPTITGHEAGGGAGATHTLAAKDPLDSLKMFYKQASGEDVPDWAKAIRRDVDPKTGITYSKIMHPTPSILRYFGAAINKDGDIDIDRVKDIISRRIQGYETGIHSKAEAEALRKLNQLKDMNKGLFQDYDTEIQQAADELEKIRALRAASERGGSGFNL